MDPNYSDSNIDCMNDCRPCTVKIALLSWKFALSRSMRERILNKILFGFPDNFRLHNPSVKTGRGARARLQQIRENKIIKFF